MLKNLSLAVILLSSIIASAQSKVGGHLYVPSTTDSTNGMAVVDFSAAGDCTLSPLTNCQIYLPDGVTVAGIDGPYVGTFAITDTHNLLTGPFNINLVDSPGREATVVNSTGQIGYIQPGGIEVDPTGYVSAQDLGGYYVQTSGFGVLPGTLGIELGNSSGGVPYLSLYQYQVGGGIPICFASLGYAQFAAEIGYNTDPKCSVGDFTGPGLIFHPTFDQFTGPLFAAGEVSEGTCTTSATIDPLNGNNQSLTLTDGDSCALTIIEPPVGTGTAEITFKLIQSSTTPFSGSFTAPGVYWLSNGLPVGSPPAMPTTSGAELLITCYLDGATAYTNVWCWPKGGGAGSSYSGPANEVVATPNGSSGAVGVRALVSGDIPASIAANTSGTAANLSGTPALPNGISAVTQTTGDNSTKLATDAFVLANASTYTLPAATSSTLGGVKPDGTTITNSTGAISVTTPVNATNVVAAIAGQAIAPSSVATTGTAGVAAPIGLAPGTSLPTLFAGNVNLLGPSGSSMTAYGIQFPLTVSAAGIAHVSALSSAVAQMTFSAVNLASADVTGLLPHANIASTAVTPGSYTNANITIAADGTITLAANGTGGGGCPTVTTLSGTTPVITATNCLQTITLSGNTTPTITGIALSQHIVFRVCQPTSGGPYSWTWPSGVNGGMTGIGTMPANTCALQAFDSFNGTTLESESLGAINVTP